MENLSPKEIYDQQKQEKLKQSGQIGKLKLAKKILILLAILVFIFSGIYLLFRRSEKKTTSPKIYAQKIEDQGRAHITLGASHPSYSSNPPTSGWHYEDPAVRGIYDEQLPDERMLHNLEHGYIWVSYKPEASNEIIKQLKSFVGLGSKIILTPRKENDKLIALAAWNWLDKFDPESSERLNESELKRIQDFIDTYINQGPEPNAP